MAIRRILILLCLPVVAVLFGCAGNGTATTLSTFETTSAGSLVSRLEADDLRSSDLVRWIGRTAYDETLERMFFYHTGTGFTVTFVGTELSVRILATNTTVASRRPYFTVSRDGEVAPEGTSFTVDEADSIVKLAEGLSYGTHTLTFLKRSESIDSVTAIASIQTDGVFLTAPAAPAMKILILGGSGASGYGNLGSPSVSRTTANSDSLQSFGYLAARDLDADFQFVAASGWGLKWGFNPTNNHGTVNIRAAFERVGIDDDEELVPTVYDVASYVPDVVIVNLGGNDFDSYVLNQTGSALTAAKAAFRAAVADLVTRLHTLYPDAWIIWTHTGSQNGAEAETAISDLDPKHDYTVILIIPKVGEYDLPEGSNNHYGIESHRYAADLLVDLIGLLS
ncbi:MAG TPA: hypothetical protein DCR44_08420 [Acholeplasmatales bacterium]|nr:MAG: hypothetical protein A2Y16_00015 [Tenericutes bacterium GWF2_57_13]HAQ57391.1 hypothetical protein [Acholeplasmatales bacterium]